MENLTSLPQTISTNINTAISNQINQLLASLAVPVLVIVSIFVVLYTYRAYRRRKVENAILEIRDTLRGMKLPQEAPRNSPRSSDNS